MITPPLKKIPKVVENRTRRRVQSSRFPNRNEDYIDFLTTVGTILNADIIDIFAIPATPSLLP
jgi:hypothetical protein